MSGAASDYSERLSAIAAREAELTTDVAELTQRLVALEPAATASADEIWSWRVAVLALEAAVVGNYGVGAVIAPADPSAQAAALGANAMFAPSFDSSAHAEMQAIDALERSAPEAGADLTLYTSLEPCPMCLSRFIASKVSALKFVAWDEGGGMVSRFEAMPPVWRELAVGRIIAPAACSPDLARLSLEIFALRSRTLDASLKTPPHG